jgi:hypothetical protein
MTMEQLERDIEDKMKSELLSVLLLTSKAQKMKKLLQSEIGILWNKKELKFQKSQIL